MFDDYSFKYIKKYSYYLRQYNNFKIYAWSIINGVHDTLGQYIFTNTFGG